uniref:18S rRNA aminocarboxypropyltransferase n=1 Tax=Theileria annulata TaxID=5874 RepID=A0A3B0N603_THEAN
MVGIGRKKIFSKKNCTNIHDVYANALKLTKSNTIPQDSTNSTNKLDELDDKSNVLDDKLDESDDKLDESELEVRMYLWHFNQCDNKRCTGKKLVRSGLVKELPMTQRFSGIILTPLANTLFSLNDTETVKNKGIAVIDCSWNKINQTPLSSFQTKYNNVMIGNSRILPFLVAGNPTHFGKPFELSCAEALASALYISNMRSNAMEVLSVFNWGPTFIQLNQEAFDLYSSKGFTSEDMVRIQEQYLNEQQTKSNQQKSINSIDYQNITDNIT